MGQIWECTLEQQLVGQLLNNVLHFEERSGAMNPGTIAVELNNNFLLQIRTLQATILTYTRWYIKKKPSTGEEATQVIITPTQSGGASLSNMYLPMCMLWSLRSDINSPTTRGRFYIGGVNAGQASGTGRWTGSYYSQGLTAANNLLTRYSGPSGTGPLKWVVYSRKFNGARAIQEIRVRDVPAIQKRRNLLVGD